MAMITNPILRGFNPDPSIVRAGGDYYIATSTFEWFPGVQIHHSRDLRHWRLLTRPLARLSQLDMLGDPNSGGIWAPCLSYSDGLFYLIYTDVRTYDSFFDTHNYLVTAPDIMGPWSEPVYLNSSGFDPSLFHDTDGRKWLVNMLFDYRRTHGGHGGFFAGIVLQEYSVREKKLFGPITNIFKGTGLGCTEGPHLYKHNGYYYLMVAEGGTGLGHAVTMARSKTMTGPYELDPKNPMLTASGDPLLALQKAGHASIVETQQGEWYMVHLTGRPIPARGQCPLGRETAIQKVVWDSDQWLRIEGNGNTPMLAVPAPQLTEHPWPAVPARDDFDKPELGIHFQTLRRPLNSDALSLTARPGFLRLRGGDSPNSSGIQSLVARRQQAFRYTATTGVEFAPTAFQHLAGLICMYSNKIFFYLAMTHDEALNGPCLAIIAKNNASFTRPLEKPVSIAGVKQCHLRATVDYDRLQFQYSIDGKAFKNIGPVLNNALLSDENGNGFTGAFVGICCNDMISRSIYADFDYFEYAERDER